MRKQATRDFTVLNAGQNQFKTSRKNSSVKKNPRYIYTEEDLGEGILDVGVNSSYGQGQQGNTNSQLWTSMRKPYWL